MDRVALVHPDAFALLIKFGEETGQYHDPVEDFKADAQEPPFSENVVQDLELDYLFTAMAGGDWYLRGIRSML